MALSRPKRTTRRLLLLSLVQLAPVHPSGGPSYPHADGPFLPAAYLAVQGLCKIHTRVLLLIQGHATPPISFTSREIKEETGETHNYYQTALQISFPSAFLPFCFHDHLIFSSFPCGEAASSA